MLQLFRRLFGQPVPEPGTKFIVFLGNPGSQYSTTRHNVAWWLADRAAADWNLGRFRKEGAASVASGDVEGRAVQLIKPLTFMNRSGQVVSPLLNHGSFDFANDFLVVVDDVALQPGRARLRASGSAGGHNGLKSVESVLGTGEYPRLRIGVGSAPPGSDLAEWVLSSPPPEERRLIQDLFGDLTDALCFWLSGDIETASSRSNTAGRGETDL
ncbi:aminoacyl-tRNA hydrolase [soil metagenome]